MFSSRLLKNKLLLSAALGLSTVMPAGLAGAQSFEEALISAYNKHPQIQAQRSRLREIDESYVQARSQGLPTSTAQGEIGETYVDREGNGAFQPATSDWGFSNSVGLNISQPLYQGGRVSGLKSQAKAQIMAARAELAFVEQNIMLSTAEAYLDVIRDEKAAQIRRNSVDILLKQLDANETRFSVGDGTRTDIAQAETRLEESKKGLSLANANLTASRASFERLVGFQAEKLSQPARYEVPATLAEAQARARNNNPRIAIARNLEDASEAAIDVAKAALKPSLFVNGSLQSGESEFSNFTRSSSFAVTAQVRVPIYTGGLNRSVVRAAKEARVQRRFETRDLEDALYENVTQSWAQLTAAREILEASRKQVESARVAFEGVELERSVGTRTALDVLDAEQELLNAELSVVNAERDAHFLTYQLLNSMGIFGAEQLRLATTYFDDSENLDGLIGKRFESPPPEAQAVTSNHTKPDIDPKPAVHKDTVLIKAKEASWVEIKDQDGTIVLAQDLDAGESWMSEVGDDYTLSTNNGSTLEVFVGSEFVGILGTDGAAITDLPVRTFMP